MQITLHRCLFLLFSLFMSATAFAIDYQKIAQATSSVVMIRGYNEDGGLAYGSGVVVDHNKVVSNCHVFRTTRQPWVARGEDSFMVTGIQADRYHDMCLLTVENLPIKPVTIGDPSKIVRGQNVLSIGHSHGAVNPLTSMGQVKSRYPFDNGNIIRSTAPFRMGASGSGLFSTEGELLGINTFKTPGRRAFFYSLPVEWLNKISKLPIESEFPIDGRTFWELDDVDKPYFMQIAIPKLNSDWKTVEKIAQNWVTAEPTTAEAWYELGNAQDQLQHPKDAIHSFEKVVELDPNYEEAQSRLPHP